MHIAWFQHFYLCNTEKIEENKNYFFKTQPFKVAFYSLKDSYMKVHFVIQSHCKRIRIRIKIVYNKK